MTVSIVGGEVYSGVLAVYGTCNRCGKSGANNSGPGNTVEFPDGTKYPKMKITPYSFRCCSGYCHQQLIKQTTFIHGEAATYTCGTCNGNKTVTQAINCSHSKSSSHWYCGHGTAQSANYHT